MYPVLPAEFFAIPELQALSGRIQRAGLKSWLKNERIPHVTGLHGWPLVYRTNLLPQINNEAQNDPIAFNFAAAHATSRKTSHRRSS